MLSGGFGVAITLVLTGLWNWRDQKRTRHAIELQEIFDYIHNTNDIVRGLVVEVEFETKEQAGDVKERDHGLGPGGHAKRGGNGPSLIGADV